MWCPPMSAMGSRTSDKKENTEYRRKRKHGHMPEEVVKLELIIQMLSKGHSEPSYFVQYCMDQGRQHRITSWFRRDPSWAWQIVAKSLGISCAVSLPHALQDPENCLNTRCSQAKLSHQLTSGTHPRVVLPEWEYLGQKDISYDATCTTHAPGLRCNWKENGWHGPYF